MNDARAAFKEMGREGMPEDMRTHVDLPGLGGSGDCTPDRIHFKPATDDAQEQRPAALPRREDLAAIREVHLERFPRPRWNRHVAVLPAFAVPDQQRRFFEVRR